MKKIIALLLILIMVFSCFACADTPDDESSSKKESSSIKESNSESSKESEHESESERESESESQTESESSSTIQPESSTSVVAPVKTEYGQFSSAIIGVKPSANRLSQMQKSASDYNKGSTYTESQLSSALSSAKKVGTFGGLAYKNAGKLINHFIENTGDLYEIDVADFLTDENALATRNEELNKALRACEALAVEGKSINVYQKEELVHHNLTGDWKYAVGSYFTSIEVRNLTVDGNKYKATFVYKVTDFYNWDPNDSTPVFTGIIATFVGDISPKDLHQLHCAGMAQEFVSHGEITYTISWTKGNTVENMNDLG